ncbi:hypothetical protein AB0D14_02070 [Streptomyces sp. NPDC048484]|uniref:hypothetical protein n=1 Tax=Streptomyces sp. NPDC048484 TaxID=3155146 RepID=UPI003442F1CD
MATPDEGFDPAAAAIQARTFAVLLVALDGRAADIEPLLEDLSVDTLGDVVHGLASMALLGMMPRGKSREPGERAALGVHLRSLLLERQSRAEG